MKAIAEGPFSDGNHIRMAVLAPFPEVQKSPAQRFYFSAGRPAAREYPCKRFSFAVDANYASE